jgi:Nucleotidyl transferase AbiEii toxin, Type IV TA system
MLPPAPRRLWDELGRTPAHFILYGGTALALHLGHRQSEDFDFFADRQIDPDRIYRTTPFLRGSQITQLPHLARIRPPVVAEGNGLEVASLLDISGTKAAVVQRRAQAKDYVDIDALITRAQIDLPTQLAAARIVYGRQFAPTPTLKALAFFGEGDLPTLGEAIKRRLTRAAAAVDPLRLPNLRRSPARPRQRNRKSER